MQTDRIKWDESMAVRCWAKWNEYYPELIVRKQEADKTVAGKKTEKTEKAAASPVTKARVAQKDTEWDGFINAMNKAM